jgi:hypothetical protein
MIEKHCEVCLGAQQDLDSHCTSINANFSGGMEPALRNSLSVHKLISEEIRIFLKERFNDSYSSDPVKEQMQF